MTDRAPTIVKVPPSTPNRVQVAPPSDVIKSIARDEPCTGQWNFSGASDESNQDVSYVLNLPVLKTELAVVGAEMVYPVPAAPKKCSCAWNCLGSAAVGAALVMLAMAAMRATVVNCMMLVGGWVAW